MIETEVKFRVKSFKSIISALKVVGAKLIWKGREENFFYDTPTMILKKEDKTLRLRREPTGKVVLTLKSSLRSGKKYKVKREYQITTDNFKNAHLILTRLGYKPWFQYTKNRQHWKVGNVVVELDTLGKSKFVEIESSKKRINEYAAILGLNWKSSTTDGYITLAQK
ncbi:class IV adenylate cyclase [Candidatus Parcubacteria bacterium]|nr:class IV adenylate cyclase [Candidatus Parcubacteria bacterium]